MSQQGCGHHHHYHYHQLRPWVDRRVFIEFKWVRFGVYTSSWHIYHHQGHLGTRTVSILQSSLGSRSHSSAGMFCTSWRASSRQTWTDAWSSLSIAQNCVRVWRKSEPDRCVIVTCNRSTLCSGLEKFTFSVFLKTQLDGAQMSLGTCDTIVGKHHLKWEDLKKWPWRSFHFVCDPKNGCYLPSCRKFQDSPSSQFFSRGCTENVKIEMFFWNIHGAGESCNFFCSRYEKQNDVFNFNHSVFLSW